MNNKKNIHYIFLLLISSFSYGGGLSKVLELKLLKCTPNKFEDKDCDGDPYCGIESRIKNNNLFKCTLSFRSRDV